MKKIDGLVVLKSVNNRASFANIKLQIGFGSGERAKLSVRVPRTLLNKRDVNRAVFGIKRKTDTAALHAGASFVKCQWHVK